MADGIIYKINLRMRWLLNVDGVGKVGKWKVEFMVRSSDQSAGYYTSSDKHLFSTAVSVRMDCRFLSNVPEKIHVW
jgi:Holliday junction resolvasome RuvABC DNA-binding subunit